MTDQDLKIATAGATLRALGCPEPCVGERAEKIAAHLGVVSMLHEVNVEDGKKIVPGRYARVVGPDGRPRMRPGETGQPEPMPVVRLVQELLLMDPALRWKWPL